MWDELVLAAAADAALSEAATRDAQGDARTSHQPVTLHAIPIERHFPIAAVACAVVAFGALSWRLFSLPLGHLEGSLDARGAPALKVTAAIGWAAWAQLSRYEAVFATICVVGGALWLGTLFSVSWLCGRATMMADGPEIGRLSLSLFRRWTLPSLVVSLVAGALWCDAAAQEGRHAHWPYGLPVALFAVAAMSRAVGRRAKRLVRDSPEATKRERPRPFAGDCSIQEM
jgi:hypothetical protein